MVTRNELTEIAKRVWPLTQIKRAEQNNGGWGVILQTQNHGFGTIESYHTVDENGHPTCHADCKEREAK